MNINMNDWMDSPLLKDIAPVKLELIKMAASQTSGKSGKDLAPVMLALITSANKKGIRFTAEEIQLILEILKDGKSAEEQAQIERTMNMVKSPVSYTHLDVYKRQLTVCSVRSVCSKLSPVRSACAARASI